MSSPMQQPSSTQEHRLRALEQEQKRDSEGQRAAWAFLWTMFWFKIATVVIIYFAASRSGESLGMIAATTWYWFVIPAGAMAGPLLFRWRLLKQRRRRAMLRQSEFTADAGRRAEGAPPSNWHH